MTQKEHEAKDMIRRHPTWTDRDIAIELVRAFDRRPLMPVIRQWIREVKEEKTA